MRSEKWSIRAPFLTPRLETPKDIAAKGEQLVPGHSSAIVQIFTPIGHTVAEISVPCRQKHTHTQQVIYQTNRIQYKRCV